MTQVDAAYWNLVAARRNVASIQSSVELAEKQLSETKSRVDAGRSRKTDVAQPTPSASAARAICARRGSGSRRRANALKLLVLGDPGDPAWAAEIVPTDRPNELAQPSLEQALATALSKRPEISRPGATSAPRSVAARKSDVLPRLDLVAAYARRGLAGAQNPDAVEFQRAAGRRAAAGQRRERGAPTGRSARTSFPTLRSASLSRCPSGTGRRRRTSRSRSRELSQATSRPAHRAAGPGRGPQRGLRPRNRSPARGGGDVRRSAAEIQLYAEQERFKAGLSTNFLVLTRQNDLTAARVTETDWR